MTKQKNSASKIEKEKFYYDNWWKPYAEATEADETLAIHYGHYEKGVKSHKEAIINKNDFIGRLLDLDAIDHKNSVFLDSGCGVGGTSIYLAKKYPNVKFIGIANSLGLIFLANKFARENHVISNTAFIVGDYLAIGIIDNFFDGVFAIEAFVRARDKKKFLHEAYRVLKSNKQLIIIDVFIKRKPSSFVMKKSYYVYTKTWRVPSIEVIENIKSDLGEVGFQDIKVLDITKSCRLSFLILNLKWFIYRLFFKKKKEEKSSGGKKSKKSIKDHPMLYEIIIFLSPILLGLSGNLRYMTISAVKKG